MSAATTRQLTMLAAISGCLSVMLLPGKVGAVHMREHIKNTRMLTSDVINKWEATGDPLKDYEKISHVINTWVETFPNHKKVTPTGAVLNSICLRLLEDMDFKAKSMYKKKLIDKLRGPLLKIHDFVDYFGMDTVAREHADLLVSELYTLTGWTE